VGKVAVEKLHAKVIVNPAAGANSTHRKWPVINRLLKHIGLSYDFQFTEGAGHAIEIARAAASDGYGCLVAVGGDGTAHEVANGILGSANAAGTSLGIVSTGTGSDFIRSVGIPRDYASACANLTSPRRLSIDVGLVEYRKDGEARQRYFLNGGGVGFDAAVVAETERMPKYLGGTIPYLGGLLRALLGYRNKQVVVEAGGKVISERVLSVVAANGGYFGGGMHVAPQARLSDGLLDLVMIGDFGKLELLRKLSMVYKGTHINLAKVKMLKTGRITIKSLERLLVHADGELLGEAPVTFSILPGALSLVV
jgi:diacylglycerol kinase (ATP)